METEKRKKEAREITDYLMKSITKHKKNYGEIETLGLKIYLIHTLMTTEEQLTSSFGMLEVAKMKYWDRIKQQSDNNSHMMALSKLIKSGKLPPAMVNIITDTDLVDVEKNMPPKMRKAMKDIIDCNFKRILALL